MLLADVGGSVGEWYIGVGVVGGCGVVAVVGGSGAVGVYVVHGRRVDPGSSDAVAQCVRSRLGSRSPPPRQNPVAFQQKQSQHQSRGEVTCRPVAGVLVSRILLWSVLRCRIHLRS